jgi:hypothetical protein
MVELQLTTSTIIAALGYQKRKSYEEELYEYCQ